MYGGRERVYTYRYTCHRQNDLHIKMGSNESHSVNISLIVRDKVTRQCHKLLERNESRSGIERRSFRLPA